MAAGPGPRLAAEQGAALTIAGLSTREYGGHVVALRGELNVVDAAGIFSVHGSAGETVPAAGGSRPGRARGRQRPGRSRQ